MKVEIQQKDSSNVRYLIHSAFLFDNELYFFHLLQAIKTGRYSYEKKTQYIAEVTESKCNDTDRIRLRSFDEASNPSQPSNTGIGDSSTSSMTPTTSCLEITHSEDKPLVAGLPERKIRESGSCQSSYKHQSYLTLDSFHKASESDEENEKIIQGLLKSQDQLIEDLDAFLDEIHMKKRQKEFHVRIIHPQQIHVF